MAINIPTYTGEQAGGLLPKFSGEKLAESQEKLFQTVLETEKFKYGERKKEEAEFLKNVYIKPEYLISVKAREEMTKAIQAYNDKWTQISKENKGILSLPLKTQMQNEKAAVEMAQNDLLENMGRWKVLQDAVVRDGGVNYDKDEWDAITADFLRTGRMDAMSPPVKGVEPISYLTTETQKIRREYPSTITRQDGRVWSGTVNMQGNIKYDPSNPNDDISSFIREKVLKDQRSVKGFAQTFSDLPNDEKRVYLEDLNGDKVLDDKDIDDNAIVRWAVQNPQFREAAVNRTGGWANPQRPPSQGQLNKGRRTTLGGVSMNMFPGVQTTDEGQRTFGANNGIPRVYSKYSFKFNQNLPIYGIPTVNGKIIYGAWKDGIDPGSVNARLVLYDPKEHIFLIETTTGSESLDTASRLLIEVPEKNISGYEDVPLRLGDVDITVGESERIYTPPTGETHTVTPAKEETSKDWSKYQRK